jgi:endonuclease/exonuclease/phosphatase family metal-dependent hydrolase
MSCLRPSKRRLASLKIGTWNVEYADSAKTNERRRSVMQNCPADIWVLTETHDSLHPGEEFSACHGRQRPLYGVRVKEGSRWVSIWSRFPLHEIEGPSENSERTVAALVEVPDLPLIVYGTVLPWHGERGRMGQNLDARNWSEHHRVIPEQINEWRTLKQRYPGAGLCVAGDFNTDMGTGKVYGTKAGIALLNQGFDELGLFCPTAPLHMHDDLLTRPPIDHIAVSDQFRGAAKVCGAFEGKVGIPRLSDHSGIVVELG